MLYSFSLKTIGLVVGVLLMLLHGLALLRGEAAREWARRFPRHRMWGIALITVAAIWAWWVAWVRNWGEFDSFRPLALGGIPVAWFLMIQFVDDFLAARALGIVMLMAALPLLEAAWLQPPASRLLVVSLAYAWVLAGMVWTSSPHKMRDWLDWFLPRPALWTAALLAGFGYGAAVLACAALWW